MIPGKNQIQNNLISIIGHKNIPPHALQQGENKKKFRSTPDKRHSLAGKGTRGYDIA